MKITIKIPNGPSIEKVLDQNVVTIGRSKNCDVVVLEESLSRQHCKVEEVNGEFFVTDLESSNGVYIDGKRLEPNVRTKYSSFFQLNLGPIECQIFDPEEIRPKTLTRSSLNHTGFNRATRMMKGPIQLKPTPAPTPPQRKTKKPEKKKSNLPTLIFLLAIFGAFAYVAFEWGSKEELTERPAEKKEILLAPNIPQEFKELPDSFLTVPEYKSKDLAKYCAPEQQTCEDLGLMESEGEGLVFENNQYFILMKPSTRESLERYRSLKDVENKHDIIALDTFFRSNLFSRFLSKKVGQVHLIIKNEDYKPYIVYRFHPKYFAYGGTERVRLLGALRDGLNTKNFKEFWSVAQPIIQVQKI